MGPMCLVLGRCSLQPLDEVFWKEFFWLSPGFGQHPPEVTPSLSGSPKSCRKEGAPFTFKEPSPVR